MISEDYVTPEQAVLLEAKGFPKENCEIYDETHRNGMKIDVPKNCYVSDNYFIRQCPQIWQVEKWLRTEKNYHICPIYEKYIGNEEYYHLQINEEDIIFDMCQGYAYLVKYRTREEAVIAGINRWLGLKQTYIFDGGEYEY